MLVSVCAEATVFRVRVPVYTLIIWLASVSFSVLQAVGFPRETIVILNGIAGDVETEQADEQILGALLAKLKTSDAKKVLVLSDAKFAFPNGLNGEKREATRANFLALADELKGQTTSVFVWGHGGNVAGKPVFHVRGARLGVDDFKKVSASFGDEWVMMFCGSGSFASGVQAANRRVLASEAETRFSSDPIAMRAVVAALSPALEFEELGRRVGQFVYSYYEERHLAQNEEPALWLEAGVVRKVALSDTRIPNAVPIKQKGLPAWTQMQRVSAIDYPEEDGVILSRRVTCVLGDSVALSEEYDEVFQILKPEGKRLGDFDVSYSPPGESLVFDACEVMAPDGTIHRLESEAIREVLPTADAESGIVRKIFSLPEVVPGALLHVRYRRSWKNFPMPQVSLEIPLQTTLPIVSTALEVRVASKAAFHFGWRGIEGPDPTVESQEYSQIYRWNLNGTAAYSPEPLVSAAGQPALMVSTWPDWAAFVAWYRRLTKLTDAVTPEISAKAVELTSGKASGLEKAEAIYNYVTKLRYVAVPLGVNSHRPHTAASVLANGFGDCKDKANLFNTMLRAIGMQSELVLVPRFTQAFRSTPGLAFNHAISRFHYDGKIYWVDCTDDVCRFGLLPPGDAGRNVLVIEDGTNGLETLPIGKMEEHKLRLVQRVDLSQTPTEVQCEGTATGIFDYEARATSRMVAAKRLKISILSSIVEPRVGTFRLAHQKATAVDALSQPFDWNISGSYSGLIAELPGHAGRILNAPFLLPAQWSELEQTRTRSLYIQQGYPGELEQQIIFRLPPDSGTVLIPEAAGTEDGPLRWRVVWRQTSGSSLEVNCWIAWPDGEMNRSQTELFEMEWKRLRAAVEVPAVLNR